MGAINYATMVPRFGLDPPPTGSHSSSPTGLACFVSSLLRFASSFPLLLLRKDDAFAQEAARALFDFDSVVFAATLDPRDDRRQTSSALQPSSGITSHHRMTAILSLPPPLLFTYFYDHAS